jgi:hypothetical protein
VEKPIQLGIALRQKRSPLGKLTLSETEIHSWLLLHTLFPLFLSSFSLRLSNYGHDSALW